MIEFARHARLAGLMYLGIILLGIGAEGALRGPLIDWSNATATAQAIQDRLVLFRLSTGFDIGMALLDVALAVLFFRMLRSMNEGLALTALVFRLMQAAIITANIMALYAAEQALTGDPLPALARHAAGYDLGLIFFAVNTLIMARLLAIPGLAPRGLCWALAAAGVVYLLGGLTRFLTPDLNSMMQPAYLIPVVAEVWLMGWLLIKGPKVAD
jgi:hypothetical protein